MFFHHLLVHLLGVLLNKRHGQFRVFERKFNTAEHDTVEFVDNIISETLADDNAPEGDGRTCKFFPVLPEVDDFP